MAREGKINAENGLENRMGVRSIFKWMIVKRPSIFLQLGPIQFWASFIALSVDHPLSKF